MKYVVLLSFLFAGAVTVNAQNAAVNQNATATKAPVAEVIQLKLPVHDFGKIPQGRPVTYAFEIINTGKEPLKLDDVQASCGCTTPEWSKDAIAPGATATIRVGYNAYAEGYFEKPITIHYNKNLTKVLTIKGTVYKAPASPAPENASVKLLNQLNN
ncbi:MAG TPA: DUF1573 domain-containing protein [Chitinophagaceae bacterium]